MLCIFDLDGTLTNTINAIAHFGNIALRENGFAEVSVDKYKYFVGDGRDKLIHRMLDYYNSDTPEMFEKTRKVYDKNYEADPMYDTGAYDGIKELIEDLKKENIKIAVCSNKPDNVVNDVVKEVFGDGVFDIVRGVKDGEAVKPDKECALRVIDALNENKDDCFFIGDTNVDIFTAKNAGIKSIGVLWGFRNYKELSDAGACYTVEKPTEILEILKVEKR